METKSTTRERNELTMPCARLLITSTATRRSLLTTNSNTQFQHKNRSLFQREKLYIIYSIYEYVSTNIYYIYNI